MKKILLADDDPAILMTLEYLMKKSGYQVFVARNGTEAMAILDEEVPDVAILDIMMPDIDGYEICEAIRQNDTLQMTKVIFLSAKSRKLDIEKGMQVGADFYMTKPFSTKELMKKIEELT